jgi:hypothetical protein
MKAILVALAVLSLGLPAYAVTDEEKFRKLLNETTVATGPIDQIVQKARAACVCRGGNADENAGVLVRRTFGDNPLFFLVSCFVPAFDTDGSATSFFECTDWELLAS